MPGLRSLNIILFLRFGVSKESATYTHRTSLHRFLFPLARNQNYFDMPDNITYPILYAFSTILHSHGAPDSLGSFMPWYKYQIPLYVPLICQHYHLARTYHSEGRVSYIGQHPPYSSCLEIQAIRLAYGLKKKLSVCLLNGSQWRS